MAADPEVLALVEQCLAALEQQGPAQVEALLQAHPRHAAAVRKRLRALAGAELLDDLPASDALPAQCGDFKPLAVLGRGGMGVVYRALQVSLGREVALKVIRPEHMFFPDTRARFRREVESVARLEHPGIVPVYVVGEEQGVPYFAMELVAGVTLEQVIQDLAPRTDATLRGDDLRACLARRLGGVCTGSVFEGSWVTVCCQLALQVVEALDHAHQRGVLHRDVKPSNIMLTAAGRVRLLDFGLARVEGTDQLTRAGAAVGSLPYMAPEQIEAGSRPVDVRTDVYALGVVLYELLALRPAFWNESGEATRRQILAGDCVPLREQRAGIPWDVATVTAMAMDADPARRYPTVDALGQDLRRVLAHQPIAARRPTPWLRARRFCQRHPVGATALLLGAALLAASVWYAVAMYRVQDQLARSHSQEQAWRERAEVNLEGAIAAIDEVLEQGSDAPFGEAPASDPARQRLLEQALHLYESLLERQGSHAALADRVVRARWRVGRLCFDLGRPEQAEAALQRAADESAALAAQAAEPDAARALHLDIRLDLVRALVARATGSAVSAAEELVAAVVAAPATAAGAGLRAVDAWQLLAKARHQVGKVAEALTAVERAVAAGEPLLAAAPDDASVLASMARALQAQAYWTGFHRLGDAAPLFERARTLQTRAIARSGNSPAGRLDLSRLQSAWAHVATRGEQWAEAIERVHAAQALLAGLLAEHPERVPFVEAWLANQYQLGWLHGRTQALERAEAELRSGIDRGAAALALHPGHAALAYRLAVLQTELARRRAPQDGEAAEALWEAAYQSWLTVRRAPPNPTWEQQVGVFFDQWARFHHQRGRSARALELLAEAARCHRAVLAQGILDPHRARLVGTLVLAATLHAAAGAPDAALGLLAQAVDEGHARRADLDTAELRQALAGRAEFAALLQRADRGRQK